MTSLPGNDTRSHKPLAPDSEADGSWVYTLAGAAIGLTPASHPDTITRTTEILGARPGRVGS